ncbi:hypothetical protein C3L33_12369, partial [Rhododendron williamsianum]
MIDGSKNTGVVESSIGASVIKPELSSPVPGGKVTSVLLNGRNFAAWSRSFRLSLCVRWNELAQYDPVSDFGATTDVAVKRMDRLHTYFFLMGLKTDFENLRGQILNTSPLPSLLDTFAIVDDDERRRLISTHTLSPAVG